MMEAVAAAAAEPTGAGSGVGWMARSPRSLVLAMGAAMVAAAAAAVDAVAVVGAGDPGLG